MHSASGAVAPAEKNRVHKQRCYRAEGKRHVRDRAKMLQRARTKVGPRKKSRGQAAVKCYMQETATTLPRGHPRSFQMPK